MTEINQHFIEASEYYGSVEGYVVETDTNVIENFLSEYTDDAPLLADVIGKASQNAAVLKSINVEEDYRGCGFGSKLMGYFLQEAEDLFADVFVLLADSVEEQAPGFSLIEFYERYDFVPVDETITGTIMVYPPDVAEQLIEALKESKLKREANCE